MALDVGRSWCQLQGMGDFSCKHAGFFHLVMDGMKTLFFFCFKLETIFLPSTVPLHLVWHHLSQCLVPLVVYTHYCIDLGKGASQTHGMVFQVIHADSSNDAKKFPCLQFFGVGNNKVLELDVLIMKCWSLKVLSIAFPFVILHLSEENVYGLNHKRICLRQELLERPLRCFDLFS